MIFEPLGGLPLGGLTLEQGVFTPGILIGAADVDQLRGAAMDQVDGLKVDQLIGEKRDQVVGVRTRNLL